MLSNLFGKKSKPEPVFAYAHLNARIMPDTRGGLFEDPLTEALQKSGLGEVTGAGTLQTASGEIEYCGIDIDMFDVEKAPEFICRFLISRGAPKGSMLEYKLGEKDIVLPFGAAEGLAIYLNGTDLPQEAYEESDINLVIDTLGELVASDENGRGMVLGDWQGPTETALYMYGTSSQKMRAAIAPFVGEYPLCQKARIVDITPT